MTEGAPPDWLLVPAAAVMEDLQDARPIEGLQVVSRTIEGLNGLTLDVVERSRISGEFRQLPDDLDPDTPTEYGGGNWVPRSLTGPELLVLVADILQERLADTDVAWAEARPACSGHSHPAKPAVHEGEAWWVCASDGTPLYQIGRREAPGG